MSMTDGVLYFAYWTCTDPDVCWDTHIGIATTLEKAVDISHKFMKEIMCIESSKELGRDRIMIEGWAPDHMAKVYSIGLPDAEKLLAIKGEKNETD